MKIRLLVLIIAPMLALSSCANPYKSLSSDQQTAAPRSQGQNGWVSGQMNSYRFQQERIIQSGNSPVGGSYGSHDILNGKSLVFPEPPPSGELRFYDVDYCPKDCKK